MLPGDFDLPTTHAIDILGRAYTQSHRAKISIRCVAEKREKPIEGKRRTGFFRFDFVFLGFLTTRETLLELRFGSVVECKRSTESG